MSEKQGFGAERGLATCEIWCGVDATAPDMAAQDGVLTSRFAPERVLRLQQSIGPRLRWLGGGVLESFERGAALLYGRRICGRPGSCCRRAHRKDQRDNSQGSKRNRGTQYFPEKEKLERMSPSQRGTVLNQPGRKIDRKQAAIRRRKGCVCDQGGTAFEAARGRPPGVPRDWPDAVSLDPLGWTGFSTFLISSADTRQALAEILLPTVRQGLSRQDSLRVGDVFTAVILGHI
jgi:hypothetical protein